jgi:Na+-translocating ferredoxin:NAD+ oxidoreductase RnfC subunit
MISIGFSPDEATAWQETALYCCECALCTLYACPEDLDPFRMMVESKRALMAKGIRPKKDGVEPIPMYDYRRTPTKMLVRRLDLERFMTPQRYVEATLKPKVLSLPLKQHAGSPSLPVVKAGQRIAAEALLADVPEGALGAKIFSPRAGRVTRVGAQAIRVEVA